MRWACSAPGQAAAVVDGGRTSPHSGETTGSPCGADQAGGLRDAAYGPAASSGQLARHTAVAEDPAPPPCQQPRGVGLPGTEEVTSAGAPCPSWAVLGPRTIGDQRSATDNSGRQAPRSEPRWPDRRRSKNRPAGSRTATAGDARRPRPLPPRRGEHLAGGVGQGGVCETPGRRGPRPFRPHRSRRAPGPASAARRRSPARRRTPGSLPPWRRRRPPGPRSPATGGTPRPPRAWPWPSPAR